MTPMSLSDFLGLSESGFKYKYQLTDDELNWVLGQLDMVAKSNGDITDNDEQDDNEILGRYADGTLSTSINVGDFVDIKLYRRLQEGSHIKKNGTLDFRRLIGKATKKYQAMLVQGTYGSPVAGDVAGSPTQPDSPSN